MKKSKMFTKGTFVVESFVIVDIIYDDVIINICKGGITHTSLNLISTFVSIFFSIFQ
jgi:hypothetical protein